MANITEIEGELTFNTFKSIQDIATDSRRESSIHVSSPDCSVSFDAKVQLRFKGFQILTAL